MARDQGWWVGKRIKNLTPGLAPAGRGEVGFKMTEGCLRKTGGRASICKPTNSSPGTESTEHFRPTASSAAQRAEVPPESHLCPV